MTVRPPYIYQGGSVLMHSPLQLKQSEMLGYFVKGELAKLQASLDATLNQVAGARMRFKALSPYVMLTFTKVGHANSGVAVDAAKGWITEIDIVTWIMVGRMDREGELEHLYWYPFHIFVDDTMALVNGRELFGYPKFDCEYEMPAPGSDPLRCSLAAKGFHPFSPETKIALHALLEVDATDTSGAHKVLGDLPELIKEAVELFLSMPDFFDMDAKGVADILSLLTNPRIEQIFLKQFPDSAGVRAVYQALLAAPATIDKVHSVKLLGYEYTCTLHAFDSFPLADTLGFKIGAQPAILPFHVNFDFTAQPGEELLDNSAIAPEKIAILGGGVSALTAAYYLSAQPGWHNEREITVYQQGWRLGGKGASGRNPAMGQRIEEHGLHIWFGFYTNAFAMIKDAYDSLGRPAGTPLAGWRDAFKQHDYVSMTEQVGAEWRVWNLVFPTLPGEPGTGDQELSLWQLGKAMIAWIREWLGQLNSIAPTRIQSPEEEFGDSLPAWMHQLAGAVAAEARELALDLTLSYDALLNMAEGLAGDSREHPQSRHSLMAATLAGIRKSLHLRYDDGVIDNDEVRRLLTVLDLSLTVMKGLLQDGVFRNGFDVINDVDLRAWLKRHGGDQALCVDSAPIRAFYDLVFAYQDGDFDRPNVEAGTMLRAMLRIGFAYKGGIMFKMQAGMGDTVFTPLYQVLVARGVKFKFFHRVEELVPDNDGVGSVRMTEQVALAAGHYQPLVTVKDLACWPNGPDYTQIDAEQAALLREKDINLESYWSDWPAQYRERFDKPLPTVTLKRGRDFDRVVFGISVGSLPMLCPKLLARGPSLRATANKVQTVATQAYQVWLDRDLAQMGWTHQPGGQQPVLSAFSEPYDTWAPMDQLLEREEWPSTYTPKNVSYFCSALPMASYPPQSDTTFPARCAALAKHGAVGQLATQIGALWPAAGVEGSFPWHWLVDPEDGMGPARFDRQYWRANVDPSERYVLSLVGSTVYRLDTDGSGFSNLYLTGDWIKTGINMGCVEAAVMAGMQTSRAMCGFPRDIDGETDF
ncbi:NAD(P)-binding protein [Massilia glaciei]|uniref:FAD-dependent oxidoreductase n=1 Tax=Massilia glaciei TaxID=1524097 RepID=A0A2U2HE88_9BURK|nr:NAD(P)-binding protein [Massilia glaciei]PWF41760.1 FAD-dependent oxidoreductase [Massilia glaciei]